MKAKHWFTISDVAAIGTFLLPFIATEYTDFAAGLFLGSWMLGVRVKLEEGHVVRVGNINVKVSDIKPTETGLKAKVDSIENGGTP